ncbi:hypothetical protein NHX12_033165 [Muraenolepis orangiensis]|uniref:Uncharacterized protein n=1 Tax=Muraenolepis orangiensis TaxID=630683 RepID=A0A9Q0IG26_9TELE|nr:hypothetical protein NHX12_033165 [Muraenolepis orangiensis]
MSHHIVLRLCCAQTDEKANNFECLTEERSLKGTRLVVDYAIDFRTRARLIDAAAQCNVFLVGLADYIKDELVSIDLPM